MSACELWSPEPFCNLLRLRVQRGHVALLVYQLMKHGTNMTLCQDKNFVVSDDVYHNYVIICYRLDVRLNNEGCRAREESLFPATEN